MCYIRYAVKCFEKYLSIFFTDNRNTETEIKENYMAVRRISYTTQILAKFTQCTNIYKIVIKVFPLSWSKTFVPSWRCYVNQKMNISAKFLMTLKCTVFQMYLLHLQCLTNNTVRKRTIFKNIFLCLDNQLANRFLARKVL